MLPPLQHFCLREELGWEDKNKTLTLSFIKTGREGNLQLKLTPLHEH